MACSKQHHFQGPYHPQNWSLPDSIIYSITKNPSNSKGYQKLIKSCKYFFAKNPIFVITKIKYEYFNVYKKRGVSFNSYKPIFNVEKYYNFFNALVNTTIKLWISDEFSSDLLGPKSLIIPKIHRCDARRIRISWQNISYNKFSFFCSNVVDIFLEKIIVKNEIDEVVPLENLVKAMPKVKDVFL